MAQMLYWICIHDSVLRVESLRTVGLMQIITQSEQSICQT